ncbi:MAG TPA: LuxR C-terminal-related transcriptional regulator [Bryobacteraceae bacterium]|jgi:DNA-binding NarL/FixJ family response regulator|nr:LuxR C-terminal-related transcriptional regulator [Bryobacteraceae bacterium]
MTRREGQIATLVSEGLANKEIAFRLSLSEGTVKVYLSKMYQKLGCKSRLELALRVKRGTGSSDPNDLLGVHLAGVGIANGAD